MTLFRGGIFFGLILTLTACGLGESRLNPANWLPEGAPEEAEQIDPGAFVTDPRPLVPQITELVLEETPGGVILRVTGLPPTQGWHSAALVSETRGRAVNGVLTFAFRVAPPLETTRVSTAASREVVVGRYISDLTLSQTQTIRVIAAENVVTARP